MRLAATALPCLAVAVIGCHAGASDDMAGPLHATTDGEIAIANLDHAIERAPGADGVELLLMRAQLLTDVDALDQATARAERLGGTAAELIVRARARAAVHRFEDALGDLAAAERLGAPPDQIDALRRSILVATGRAAQVLPALEEDVARRPGFASRAALAAGYAAVGRLDDADRMYAAALDDLQTTSPFPYAWTYFARGHMWAEQGNDPERGEAYLRRALAHLPAFAAATAHLAWLEIARGDLR